MINSQGCNYDVLIFTETWLTDGILDPELNLSDFTIYRTDRSLLYSCATSGGGVLIAVKKRCNSRLVPSSTDIKQLFVSITIGKELIIIGSVYFPPKTAPEKYMSFSDNVDSLVNHLQPTQICLIGEFNLPHAAWSQNNFSSSTSPTERAPANESISIEIISNTICLHNLFQINNILNNSNSLLDLVMIQKKISSSSLQMMFYTTRPLPSTSILHYQFLTPINSEICPSGYYHDFKSANLMLIRELLDQVSYDELLKNKPLDHMIITLYEILYIAIDLYVPLKKYSSRKFPMYSSELKSCIIDKKKAHLRHKSSNSADDYYKFSSLRALAHRLAKRDYQNYIKSIEHSVTVDIKAFWRFANGKRKTIAIPPELSYNGEVCSSGGEIANLIAEYISTVYCNKAGVTPKLSWNRTFLMNFQKNLKHGLNKI
ncbi:hypothetical protein JTB14_010124 [Gonioctena quinquepunctata]|nr:hypothetical protein JTB14_010124 [Gonioctena quinquepunctata]